MMLEDCLLINGEGWSVLSEIIGIPKYSCVHGVKLQTSELTVYRFYSIFYDRFFDMPKNEFTYNKKLEGDCCSVEWSDDIEVSQKVMFWNEGPKLSVGRVKSMHNGNITIISENKAYVVNEAIVVKFEHQYINIENCKNETYRCECGAIKTERAHAS